MIIHGGVDQSETSFADTYILVGLASLLGSSQDANRNQTSDSSSSLVSTTVGGDSRRTSAGTGFNGE